MGLFDWLSGSKKKRPARATFPEIVTPAADTREPTPPHPTEPKTMTTFRTETDTFGPIEVDNSKYWGAQAQRSLGNFKIGWEKQPLPIVRALGIVKRAAAETNMALGKLDPAINQATALDFMLQS